MAHSFRVLHNDAHVATARAIRDLNPIARVARLGRQVHTKGRDGVARRILVQFGHQQVVVFHAQRELLHVNVVQHSVLAAQQQKRAGRVMRRDRREILRLPELGQRIPHAYFAHAARGDELRADEEERINLSIQIKIANKMSAILVEHDPQSNERLKRDGQQYAHLIIRATSASIVIIVIVNVVYDVACRRRRRRVVERLRRVGRGQNKLLLLLLLLSRRTRQRAHAASGHV